MSHPCASDILEMLRTLMHHLEDAPVEQASFDSVSSSTEIIKVPLTFRDPNPHKSVKERSWGKSAPSIRRRLVVPAADGVRTSTASVQ